MKTISLASGLPLAASLLIVTGCQNDTLVEQFARFTITPLPSPTQAALESPVGIDCGRVPMFGADTAVFELENVGSSIVEINDIKVVDTVNGEFTAAFLVRSREGETSDDDNYGFEEIPAELDTIGTVGSFGRLEVTYTPTGADGALGSATIELHTNAGEDHNAVVLVEVRGEAWFIGEPNLEIQYAGQTYEFPEDCDIEAGTNVCNLPTLAFGNVSLDATAATNVVLRNLPAAGTCRLPPLPDGEPDCTVTCAVTFDKDPAHLDLGVGFEPNDAGFGISGSSSVPFHLAPLKSGCPDDPGQRMVRGQIELVLNFVAESEAGDHTSKLVLESNDPGAPLIEIPLSASSKEAPVAVARLRLCDVDNPPPACNTAADDIEPLHRAYLDGRSSYDPSGGTIEGFRWEIINYPDGATPVGCTPPVSPSCIYSPQDDGQGLFSVYVPLAGDYVIRLHVTNSEGVESGIGPDSDVFFSGIPASRFHLQLVWDHPQNDQDLHLVQVDENGESLVYHAQNDCYFRNCKPACAADPDCEPPWWFIEDEIQQDGNPRLDRDDTNGQGPENINIDRPRPGRYHVYAHYYGFTSVIDDLTQVTARIYLDGVLRQELRQSLYRNEIWAVAEIHWKEDNTAVVLTPDPETNTIQQILSLPGEEGWLFEPSPF